MAKEIEAFRGDELRVKCPDCGTTWSTLRLPSECDTCGAVVTIHIIKRTRVTQQKTPGRLRFERDEYK
jgi:ribosomal protein S27E